MGKYPNEKPGIISDNGPQFISRDFKDFIRISSMTHVRTSPYYPQSNGKIEQWHQSLKRECIRPKTPLDMDDARRLVFEFLEYYNTMHFRSVFGYITPNYKLEEKEKEIFTERDRKIAATREIRKIRRNETRKLLTDSTCKGCEVPKGLDLDSNENILSKGGLKIPVIVSNSFIQKLHFTLNQERSRLKQFPRVF